MANCFASSKIFRKTQFRDEQDFVVALFGEFHELNWIKRNWMFHMRPNDRSTRARIDTESEIEPNGFSISSTIPGLSLVQYSWYHE